MAWSIIKTIFKVTDSISSKISPSLTFDGVQLPPTTVPPPTPVSPSTISDIQDDIEELQDEGNYNVGYVFNEFDYFSADYPFYFHFEVPIGTTEVISASVSFEAKDYRNSSLTDSRYFIDGVDFVSATRPHITFYVSEDKGCLFGDAYGPYEVDMRGIDISGDLTGEGIKILRFNTDKDVCVSARVFLRVKIDKDLTPESQTSNLERPEVRTLTATSVTDTTATLNGEIIKAGGGSIMDKSTGEYVPITTCEERGFRYGTTQADTSTEDDATGNYVKGTFALGVTGLTPETDYYFRVTAKNKVGRSYGEYVKLTTTAPVPVIFVSYQDAVSEKYYTNSYGSDGTYITQWEVTPTELYYGGNVLCIDVDGNVYNVDSDNHGVTKRNSSGTITLNKYEADRYIYNIAAGPDGYIYTVEFDGDFNAAYIAKRGADDLVRIDTITIDAAGNKNYEGFVIDSDGNFYLAEASNDKFEKWTWEGGMTTSRDAVNAFVSASLGVAGTKLGSLDSLGKHPITIPTALNDDETDGELTDITRPRKVGTISGYLLYAGEDEDSNLWIGKYSSALAKQWTVQLADSTQFEIAGIMAYPF